MMRTVVEGYINRNLCKRFHGVWIDAAYLTKKEMHFEQYARRMEMFQLAALT